MFIIYMDNEKKHVYVHRQHFDHHIEFSVNLGWQNWQHSRKTAPFSAPVVYYLPVNVVSLL